jgi:hypothetical protein
MIPVKLLSKISNTGLILECYLSGEAVRPKLPNKGLEIISIGEHHTGPAKGLMTISFANPEDVISGKSFSSIKHILVPISNLFFIGGHLTRLPDNSIPMELLFPKNSS